MNEARRQNRNSHLAVQFLFRCPCAAFCRWHQNRLAKFLSGRDEKAAAEKRTVKPESFRDCGAGLAVSAGQMQATPGIVGTMEADPAAAPQGNFDHFSARLEPDHCHH
jgi:hypothetical protein